MPIAQSTNRKMTGERWRYRHAISFMFVFVTWCLHASISAAQDIVVWPTIKMPNNLAVFAMGDQMNVNGLWVRLQGFVSSQSPEKIVDAFRESLGQPLVENTDSHKQILGRAVDHFYVTIVVESAQAGSKGTIAISDLGTFSKNRDLEKQSNAKWTDRLPAGSAIVSRLRSTDGGKNAEHLVIINRHAETLNRDALLTLMREDGYVLEREMTADVRIKSTLPDGVANGCVLYFTAPRKEAMAVVARNGDHTAIVLNMVDLQQAAR